MTGALGEDSFWGVNVKDTWNNQALYVLKLRGERSVCDNSQGCYPPGNPEKCHAGQGRDQPFKKEMAFYNTGKVTPQRLGSCSNLPRKRG